jgi:hypothetical protein
MSNQQSNVSDITLSTVNNGGALSLPLRTEKTFLSATNSDPTVNSDFSITAAKLAAINDYIHVRLPGRGGNTPGIFNGSPATYYFLINPAEVQIQRQTVDAQTYTRSGWQIGVWGEDFVTISIRGKTPGKFFAFGTTDFYTPFTESYRNLLALEMVFENNGYWWEGEQIMPKISTATRRIKMHQDVELMVGEFVWQGMFESMEVNEDADSTFLADFSLTFIAWLEGFRNNTPYNNPLGGNVERGHVPVPGSGMTPQLPAPAQSQQLALTDMVMHPTGEGIFVS